MRYYTVELSEWQNGVESELEVWENVEAESEQEAIMQVAKHDISDWGFEESNAGWWCRKPETSKSYELYYLCW